ncbi:MAG: hypothetical protein ACNA8W_14140 [Bradymonadaceae bacterium]
MALQRIQCIALGIALMMVVGCGYLDDELMLSDEEFEAGFEEGAIGLGSVGYGTSGGRSCGGGYGTATYSFEDTLILGHIIAGEAEARPAQSTLTRPANPTRTTNIKGEVDAEQPRARLWGEVFVDLSGRRGEAAAAYLSR